MLPWRATSLTRHWNPPWAPSLPPPPWLQAHDGPPRGSKGPGAAIGCALLHASAGAFVALESGAMYGAWGICGGTRMLHCGRPRLACAGALAPVAANGQRAYTWPALRSAWGFGGCIWRGCRQRRLRTSRRAWSPFTAAAATSPVVAATVYAMPARQWSLLRETTTAWTPPRAPCMLHSCWTRRMLPFLATTTFEFTSCGGGL